MEPPPPTDGSALLTLVGRAYRRGRRRMEQVVRTHGVTAAQFHILLSLSQEIGLSGKEVAARAAITPQAAHAAIATLERKGLVTRGAETAHRRMVRSVLTDDGARVVGDCLQALSDMSLDMGGRLPDRDRQNLIRLLERYVATLPSSADVDPLKGIS